MSDRCKCGARVLDQFIGVYSDAWGTHSRDQCIPALLSTAAVDPGWVPTGPPPAPPACERCALWDALNSVAGKCRRGGPYMHTDGMGVWPVTNRKDWCGEFRAAKEGA